jgi:uncharacterized SAM-binding protein YcdF (DUF218 family)
MIDVILFIKSFIKFIVLPYGIFYMLLIVGLFFLYKKKCFKAKIFLTMFFVLFTVFSYPPLTNLFITHLEETYPKYDYNNKVSYIHVLGGGFKVDPFQPTSSLVGSSSAKRILEGVIIHKKMPNSKLIITGRIKYGDMYTKLAMELGVKKEDIIIYKDAKDTKEEAEFTKSIVGTNQKFALVTSASHMPRAIILFESLGLKPIAAPTDFKKYYFTTYFATLNVASIEALQIAVKEYLGILWAKITN